VSKFKLYEVTVTPSVVLYSGTHVAGTYKVDVYAETAAKAISKARSDRRAEEGRMAPSAKFSAKLKQGE
jgi:hypothetical protein